MGVSLYSLHVPSRFGGRAGSDVSRSHIFPQGVLAAITLVGGGAGDEGARARASPLLSGQHHPTGGGGRSQGAEAEALRVRSKLALSPVSVCSPSPQHWHLYPREKQCWSERGWSRPLAGVRA